MDSEIETRSFQMRINLSRTVVSVTGGISREEPKRRSYSMARQAVRRRRRARMAGPTDRWHLARPNPAIQGGGCTGSGAGACGAGGAAPRRRPSPTYCRLGNAASAHSGRRSESARLVTGTRGAG